MKVCNIILAITHLIKAVLITDIYSFYQFSLFT